MKHNTSHLNAEINKLLKQGDLKKVSSLIEIQKNWHVIVGEGLANYTYPSEIKNSTLIVLASDSAYSSQLRFYEKQILKLIFAFPEAEHLKKIYFKIGDVPTQKPNNCSDNQLININNKNNSEDTLKEKVFAHKIESTKLRATFERWFIKSNLMHEL